MKTSAKFEKSLVWLEPPFLIADIRTLSPSPKGFFRCTQVEAVAKAMYRHTQVKEGVAPNIP